ncbi:MAG: hypothetical protein ACOYNN_09490, partial [Terrimicrobiaceae bacterium]
EEKQKSDIAKRKKELEAKGAPTTQEAPTPPAEPVTTTTTAKMSDAGVITGTEKDQEAIKKQQEKISDLAAKGELTPAQASQYGEQLGKRSQEATIERQRQESEKAVEKGLDRVATAASFVPVIGQGVAALHAGSLAARGALYGGKKMDDSGKMVADDKAREYYTDAAITAIGGAALPAAVGVAGKAIAKAAPAATATVKAAAAKAGEAAAKKIGAGIATVAGEKAATAVGKVASAAAKAGPNPVGMAAGGLAGVETARQQEMGLAAGAATVLGGALLGGYATSAANKIPGLGKVVAVDAAKQAAKQAVGAGVGEATKILSTPIKSTLNPRLFKPAPFEAIKQKIRVGIAAASLLGQPAMPAAAAGEGIRGPGIVHVETGGVAPKVTPATPKAPAPAPATPKAPAPAPAPATPKAPAPAPAPAPATPKAPAPSATIPGMTVQTPAPSQAPSQTPQRAPSQAPSQAPAQAPSQAPAQAPSQAPQKAPSQAPAQAPSQAPAQAPQQAPSQAPAQAPPPAPTPVTPPVTPPATPPVVPPVAPIPDDDDKKRKPQELSQADLDLMYRKLGEFEPGEVAQSAKSFHKKRGGEEGAESPFDYHRFFRVPSEIAMGYRRSTQAQRAGIPESNDQSVSNSELYKRIKSAVGNYLNSKEGQELNNHLTKIRKTR